MGDQTGTRLPHALPEDIPWRLRNVQRIVFWFHSNRIDPYDVPIDGAVVWDNDVIVYGVDEQEVTTPLLRRWGGFRSHGPDRLCTKGIRGRTRGVS